jgi:predicted ATPase
VADVPARGARRVVLTGGPGAGKTAVLELARVHLARVVVLPEAASVVFGGGFPRRSSHGARCAAQRAIYHVQAELEALALADTSPDALVLCDRGTLDGLAYWPDGAASFFAELGTAAERELLRYSAVIHLRTPSLHDGYNHQNPLRVESAAVAATIDAHIGEIWRAHPRYIEVASAPDFLVKVDRVLALIAVEIAEIDAAATARA